MIERHWKGIVKFDEAENYIHHLKHDTFKKLTALNGFVSAKILKRDLPEGIEFMVVTTWDSIEAIKQFAGNDIQTAVVPKVANDMMIRCDAIALHYEVVNG